MRGRARSNASASAISLRRTATRATWASWPRARNRSEQVRRGGFQRRDGGPGQQAARGAAAEAAPLRHGGQQARGVGPEPWGLRLPPHRLPSRRALPLPGQLGERGALAPAALAHELPVLELPEGLRLRRGRLEALQAAGVR